MYCLYLSIRIDNCLIKIYLALVCFFYHILLEESNCVQFGKDFQYTGVGNDHNQLLVNGLLLDRMSTIRQQLQIYFQTHYCPDKVSPFLAKC